MESPKKSDGHYFLCLACGHVTKAKSPLYAGKCPVCGGLMEHNCSEAVWFMYITQIGGVEDVRKG